MDITTTSVLHTRAVGAAVARNARPGDVYALIGDLGAGKTEFVRGFVAALDAAAPVRSPSFTILNLYEARVFTICHFDFYRIKARSELGEIGFWDYVNGDGVCLVEWADLFMKELPPEATRIIRFYFESETHRRIESDTVGLDGSISPL